MEYFGYWVQTKGMTSPRVLLLILLLSPLFPFSNSMAESLDAKIHELLPIAAFEQAHREYLTFVNQDDSNVSLTGDIEQSYDSNGASEEYRLISGNLSADEPIPITRDSFIPVGLVLDKERYQKISLSLNTIAADVGFGTFLNDDLLLLGVLEPGIYSDFEGALHSHDIFVPGLMEVHYRVSKQMEFNAGVLTRDIDSSDAYVPLLGFVLSSPSGQWTVHALLPVQARISYAYRKPFEVYAQWLNGGNRYRVDGRIPGEGRTTLEVNEMRYGVGIRTKVTKMFSVILEGGIVRASSFEINSVDDRKEYLASGGYGTVSLELGW